jgi:hypothetical protein
MQESNYFKEESKFFIEILLTHRKHDRLESATSCLLNATSIYFDVQSSDVDESYRQLEYINKILQKCPNIKEVKINLHSMSISKPIELFFLPTVGAIKLNIIDAQFEDNQSNMISIFGAKRIDITFFKCQFSLSRLIEFASFVDKNAQRFISIEFSIENATIVDVGHTRKLRHTWFRRFEGKLAIADTRWCHSNATAYSFDIYLATFTIVQFFSGVKVFELRHLNTVFNQSIVEYISNFPNLTHLVLDPYTIGESGASYWQDINKIVQKCPQINNVVVRLNNIFIDEPIDLQFLPIEHDINVIIHLGIFFDKRANMLCIGDAHRVAIQFDACQFTFDRLKTFGEFVDSNWQKFSKIEFANVNDELLIDEALNATPFNHISFDRPSSSGRIFSIVINQSAVGEFVRCGLRRSKDFLNRFKNTTTPP